MSKKGFVTFIPVDGEEQVLALDHKISMDELRNLIGGWVELVPVRFGSQQLIVDEEGRLKGKPFNKKASQIALQEIVGDVVLLSGSQSLD